MNDNTGKLYEVSFISRSENGAALMVGHLTRFGAEITKEGELKKIKLAYPIVGETAGYFGCINCRISGDAVGQVLESTKLDNELLRVLVVEPQPEQDKTSDAQFVSSQRGISRTARPKVARPEKTEEEAMSNEALEEKLEEILQ